MGTPQGERIYSVESVIERRFCDFNKILLSTNLSGNLFDIIAAIIRFFSQILRRRRFTDTPTRRTAPSDDASN